MRFVDRVARSLRKGTERLSRRPPASPIVSGEPIFLHRPHGYPCHGITQEVISDFASLADSVIRNSAGNQYRAPADVTFVTYHNYLKKCLIELCYEAYGIHDFVVLGRDVLRWDWSAKVKLVLDYLESGACTTRYVLCTDADDVLMVQDPSPMLDRFRACSCDLLFCNTFVDYPPNKEYRDFETLQYYTHPLHCRLSAGAYIAERKPLMGYLRELAEAYDKKIPWAFYDDAFVDQLAWRYLHSRSYPKIQVDYRSLIFKRYDLFLDLD